MSQYPNVKFMLGAWQPGQFPEDTGAEVALVGRSNAGKSSALNALMSRKGLARISKTPGLTQQINFFEINPGERLVDLPGYGFAKVPARIQEHWRELMTRYFEARQSLTGIIVIMDARRPLRDLDWQMLEWAEARNIPAHLVLTKCDKLSRDEGLRTLKQVRAEAPSYATAQLFSAVTRAGVDEARAWLEARIKEPRQPQAEVAGAG
jgi:GTP-binding protein